MVAGMWWFFTLLMVSSYTANLAACLTTENPDSHFNDIEELVERADKLDIKYGAKSGGATANFFIVMSTPGKLIFGILILWYFSFRIQTTRCIKRLGNTWKPIPMKW